MQFMQLILFPNKILAKLCRKLSRRIFLSKTLHWIFVFFIFNRIFSYIIPLLPNMDGAASLLGVYPPAIVSFLAIWAARSVYHPRQNKNALGKSRFAEGREVRHLTGAGIVFGRKDGKLIEKATDVEGNVLVVGAPGTGKSACVAIPTLLRFDGGALVIDIKGELSGTTRNSRNGDVYIFDPVSGGDGYDPLLEARSIDGAQELARILIPEPLQGDTMWAKNAQGIFAAAILEASSNGGTFVNTCKRVCLTDPEELIAELQASPIEGTRLLSSVGVGLTEKTLSGVMSELKSKIITLASDSGVDKATSYSDWTPRSLEQGATIYIRIPEHMLNQYKDIMAIIVNQVLRHLEQRTEHANPPILLLLDELYRLGPMPRLVGALSTLRSRNVHILTLIQSLAQLDLVYGVATRKVIADTCQYKFVLSAGDPETQRYFSELAGQKTVKLKSTGSSRDSYGNESTSVSYSSQGVPLIRPEEFDKLGENPILFIPAMRPIRIEKAYWFEDKKLRALAK